MQRLFYIVPVQNHIVWPHWDEGRRWRRLVLETMMELSETGAALTLSQNIYPCQCAHAQQSLHWCMITRTGACQIGCVDFRDPISLSDYLMEKILPILMMVVRMSSVETLVREMASKVVTKHRQLRRFAAAQHEMSQRNVQEYRIFENKNICLQPLWLMLILLTSNMFIG